ncbi:hypothetical protein Tco_1192192 [Tanacetum coccineum]
MNDAPYQFIIRSFVWLRDSEVNGLLCSDEDECVLSLVKNDNHGGSYIVVTSDDALLSQRAGAPRIKEQKMLKGSKAENSSGIKKQQNKKSRRVENRNTIGDVSLECYRLEKHVGYDKEGRKIMRKESPDMIDRLALFAVGFLTLKTSVKPA